MSSIEQQAVFAIGATVIASFLYFALLDWIKGRGKGPVSGLVSTYIIRKVSGFLLLGVVPGFLAWALFHFDTTQAGLVYGETGNIWHWVAIALVFFVSLNLLNSRNKEIQSVYPELRLSTWRWDTIFLAAGGWIFYLAGYEYLFRGLLLFSCYEAFGLWPAVIINLALYSALHLPKGMKEAVTAIPFGALICYLTLESHSILAAIIIHAVQAVSIEMLCIWRNPEMKFSLKK